MQAEEKKLLSKIQYLEDTLLRSKNPRETERLNGELCKLRRSYGKIKFESMRSS